MKGTRQQQSCAEGTSAYGQEPAFVHEAGGVVLRTSTPRRLDATDAPQHEVFISKKM